MIVVLPVLWNVDVMLPIDESWANVKADVPVTVIAPRTLMLLPMVRAVPSPSRVPLVTVNVAGPRAASLPILMAPPLMKLPAVDVKAPIR